MLFVNKKRRDISIHAPIVGCDISYAGYKDDYSLFQSTHPSWGATFLLESIFLIVSKISIHAPIVGCDLVYKPKSMSLVISIHAPIVGCDFSTY